LITDKTAIAPFRINIIDAPVSSGKTKFALETIPEWAGSPSRILYLIDTSNGEFRLQQNLLTISRQSYSFYDYGKKCVWGEQCEEAKNNMPVMTYAAFASEVFYNADKFRWTDFDYIICDEMQNLVNYQRMPNGRKYIAAAETILRILAAAGTTKIIALSATPQEIHKRFGTLCHTVPFDRTHLKHLKTANEIPYSDSIQDIILRHKGQTGILYTTEIEDMKRYIEFANQNGIRANGFWSINALKAPMAREQLDLRETVLGQETIPAELDLLVINAASETCIKIQGEKRKVDYMIVHNSNEEVKTQVRGRYHGDLAYFYYHDVKESNTYKAKSIELPSHFLNTRLYSDRWPELCKLVGLKRAHGGFYSMPTVAKYLNEHNYEVVKKKDSHTNGKYYYYITARDTNCVV